MLLCCVDLYVEAVLTTLGPGIFDWEAAGGGSSRETSVRQWLPPVLALLAQPQAQPVRGAAHVSPSPRPAPPCPGMPPGPGPSLLRAFHQALTANPSRLKTQDRGENGERFIFRKWGVGAHH